MSPTLRVLQLVTPRRTLREWQRHRHVQIFAELSALRQDLARLIRLTSMRAGCDRCRHVTTVRLGEDGWWRCARCFAYLKENSA